MTKYFVSYKRHNKTTDAWAYKYEFSSEDLNECVKKFHAVCTENMDSNTFDYLCVELTDINANVLKSEIWTTIVPEPQPEPEV